MGYPRLWLVASSLRADGGRATTVPRGSCWLCQMVEQQHHQPGPLALQGVAAGHLGWAGVVHSGHHFERLRVDDLRAELGKCSQRLLVSNSPWGTDGFVPPHPLRPVLVLAVVLLVHRHPPDDHLGPTRLRTMLWKGHVLRTKVDRGVPEAVGARFFRPGTGEIPETVELRKLKKAGDGDRWVVLRRGHDQV